MEKRISVLRMATSLIFIVSGLGHFLRPQQIISQLGKNAISQIFLNIPYLETIIFTSGIPLLFFGVMLLVNRFNNLTTSILLVATFIITAVTHLGIESMGPLTKNLIIMASLYVLKEQKESIS
jgi:putative oxidoreductase